MSETEAVKVKLTKQLERMTNLIESGHFSELSLNRVATKIKEECDTAEELRRCLNLIF